MKSDCSSQPGQPSGAEPVRDPSDPGGARLLALLDRGDLLRGAWTDGQERMCALAALSDEARDAKDPSACPAEVMPAWLAYLVPYFDDCGGWGARMRRLGQLALRWHVLDEPAWERVRVETLCGILDVATEAVTVDEWGALDAVRGVQDALRGRGDLQAARTVARAAADAARASARAAWAGARAAWVAARVAEVATGAARATGVAAGVAAGAAGWDRITDLTLDAIEQEIRHEQQ